MARRTQPYPRAQQPRLADADPATSILRNPRTSSCGACPRRWNSENLTRVLELALSLESEKLPPAGRKAQYFVEVGRAHALQRGYRHSLNALLRAERVVPQHVPSMNIVHELVGHMMGRSRRDLTTDDLGCLAQRIGAVPGIATPHAAAIAGRLTR
jgi:hypothetical protein